MSVKARRTLTIAAVVGATAAGLLTVIPAANAVGSGGLNCSTWISNSQGFGRCTGASNNTTKWVLHVGCNLNPVVNTETLYGPSEGSIGCWYAPGVNDVWITFG
jgi:hypothetical protein